MLAAYSTRRSSVVLNPRARVLAGLGDGDGGGAASGDGGSGFGFGDGAGADGTSTGNVGQGDAVGTLGVVDVVATVDASTDAAVSDVGAAIDAADMDLGAAMQAAADKAASDKLVASLMTKGINASISKTGPLGMVVAGLLSISGLTSAAVTAGMNGNTIASSVGIDSAGDTVASAVNIVNANPNLPQAVKTTVMGVQNKVAAIKEVLQANNFDLRSPAYKRFLPENGGLGIPALYKEIRDFITTHNKAEIDQAMQASGVSNSDVIAAFQELQTKQPGAGTNLAFLAAIAASYFILGA